MYEQRSIFLPVLLAVLISAIVCGVLGYYVARSQYNVPNPTITTASDDDGLEAAVYSAIEQSTSGTWDKKLEVTSLDASELAAKGKWYAHDQWDWIAWQQTGVWIVSVSKDGFNCNELDTIPDEYAAFFHDVIYPVSPDKRYCL